MLPPLLDPRPYFADLPDPRRETQNKLHKLHDILMMVLCAVLGGVEDWVGMEAFAEEKETWLRGFLELPNGIPSHDTLSDVMGRIDPGAFQTAFTAWATAALPGLADEQVCVDGKAVRGSRKGDDPAVHLVSAFAGRARWVAGATGRRGEIQRDHGDSRPAGPARPGGGGGVDRCDGLPESHRPNHR